MAKKNGVELAKAYVQIIPSMEGVQQGIEDALNGGSGGMGDIGARAGEELGSALSSAFSKAAAFIGDSIETGMGFDSAVSQIAATMGTAVSEISEMREAAREMGSETNYSATQAAEGLNILAMSGYNAEQSMDMLGDVLHLAAAGSMEMSTAAADISGAMKGFDDATKDSAYYADLMAKGATLANTSVKQLGEALSTGSAMGKAYSQTAEDMTVSLLRLAEQGETGSNAATMLAAAYANIYTPMDQAKKAMQELGVEAYDPTTGKAREFNEVINELNEAITEHAKKNGEVDEALANQYKDLIFGKQGLEAYNKLVVTSIDRQEEWRESLVGASGAASEQYDTMTDNLQGDIDKMKSAFEDLQIEISDQVTPNLRTLMQVATDGLAILSENANTVVGVIEAIGVAFAAIKLPAMIGAAKTAMTAFNAVCAQNGLLAIFTAAVAAGLMLKGVTDDLTDDINEIPDAFEGLNDGEIDFVKKTAEYTDNLEEATDRLKEAEDKLHNARNERFVTESNLRLALREYNELMEKGTQSSEDFARVTELSNEVIPALRDKLKEQDAAVGELSAAYLSVKDNVRGLTEAQEAEQQQLEETAAAEQQAAEEAEKLAQSNEQYAESVKTAMKDALSLTIDVNGEIAELSRKDAESIAGIIDEYDKMYESQKKAIESTFDLFNGFKTDTSVTFGELMKNLQDTNFYMKDWATAIEQLGEKGVSKRLLEELKGMGADGWKYIYALNHASEEQLKQYSDLWEQTSDQVGETTERMLKGQREEFETELADISGIPDAKIDDFRAAFERAGFAGVDSFAKAIEQHFDKADAAVDKLVDEVKKQVEASGETLEESGLFIVKGLDEGMTGDEGMKQIDRATVEMSDEIKEKFSSLMEINSPSGVFEDYGKNLDLGLAGGIKDNAGEAVNAVRYMAETVISAAEDALSAADLSLDLGVNAAVLDRAANVSASYSVKASDKSESAKTPSPATFRLVAGSRVVAEWLFPDMNDLLGKTTTLQLKGVAT